MDILNQLSTEEYMYKIKEFPPTNFFSDFNFIPSEIKEMLNFGFHCK